MKPVTRYKIRKLNPDNVNVINKVTERKRYLEFNIDGEHYSVVMTLPEKNIEAFRTIVISVDEDIRYNLTIERQFIVNAFNDYCSVEEMMKIPDDIRSVAIEVYIERFLKIFDKCCKCKSKIIEMHREKKIDHNLIYLQYELTSKRDNMCLKGLLHTDYEGMKWFLSNLKKFPDVTDYKINNIPVSVEFFVGNTILKTNELEEVDINDIIMVDKELSNERPNIEVTIGSLINLGGKIDKDGKIMIDDTTFKHAKKDIEQTNIRRRKKIDSMIKGLNVKIEFKVGEAQIMLDELISMQPGYTFETKNCLERPVEIIANGQTVGRGELVKIGDRLGVRVLKLKFLKKYFKV